MEPNLTGEEFDVATCCVSPCADSDSRKTLSAAVARSARDDRLERGGVAGHRPHSLGSGSGDPPRLPHRPHDDAAHGVVAFLLLAAGQGGKVRAGDGEQRAEHGAVAIEPSRDPEEPPKPVAHLSRRHLVRAGRVSGRLWRGRCHLRRVGMIRRVKLRSWRANLSQIRKHGRNTSE